MRAPVVLCTAVALGLLTTACGSSSSSAAGTVSKTAPATDAVTTAAVTTAAMASATPAASATTAGATAPAAASTATASTGAASTAAATTTAAGTTQAAGAATAADVCSLLPVAQASALTGKKFSTAKASSIATGQDQCDYTNASEDELIVIVYQPTSGVTFQMMTTTLAGVGATKPVAGVGDKAIIGATELDAQSGTRLVAVQGPGLLNGETAQATAVAKAVIAALH